MQASTSAAGKCIPMSPSSIERVFEAELLRRVKAAVIEEAEKLPIVPIDLGSYLLNAKGHQVHQQLGQQRAADALAAVIRIDPDRVHDRRRLQVPELAEVHARHDEADRAAVA